MSGSTTSGRSTGFKMSSMAVAQRAEQGLDVAELLARDAAAQILQDACGRLHAHIGGDEARLEIVQDLGIDLASDGQQILDVGGEPRRAHVQLGAQSLEKAADAGLFGFVRHRSGSLAEDPGR